MTYTGFDGNVIDYDIIYDVSDWNPDSKYNCFIAGDQPFEEIHNPNMSDGSSCVVTRNLSVMRSCRFWLIIMKRFTWWITGIIRRD